jgi:hypothetical protein
MRQQPQIQYSQQIQPRDLAPQYPPLKYEQRTHVDTACAAYHLGRKPQTADDAGMGMFRGWPDPPGQSERAASLVDR